MKKFNFFEKLWEHGRTLRRVGLVLVMCLITITQVWADQSIGSVYAKFNFNGESEDFEYWPSDDRSNPVWNLGNLTSGNFEFKEVYWKCSSNWAPLCNAKGYYKINGGSDQLLAEYVDYSGKNGSYEIQNTGVNNVIATANTGNSGAYECNHWFYVNFKNTGDGWNTTLWISNNSKNYTFKYNILPPNATAITATPTGAISGSGTELDPYIVPYGGNLTIALSGSTKERADDNSSVQYSVDGGSTWGTSSKTFSNVTATSTQNWVFKARCYNSTASLASPDVTEKTVYYKAAKGVTVYKFQTKSSGLGTGNVCAATGTNYPMTTGDGKPLQTLIGGTLTASTSSTTQLKYATNSFQFTGGGGGLLTVKLDNPIKSGDVVRYISNTTSDNTMYLRKTNSSTTTDQLTLAGSNTYDIQTQALPASFAGVTILCILRNAGTDNISYFEILRPDTLTLNANTGSVSPSALYVARGEATALPHATKANNWHKGWFAASSGGDPVANPYTSTGNRTLYAQYDACSSKTGSLYKFVVKSTLTAGSPFAQATNSTANLNVGNYLSALYGGTLDAYGRNGYLDNTTSAFTFKNNAPYLLVTLDCPLQAGDQIKSIVSISAVAITTSSTRSTTNTLATGTNTVAIPADFKGASTIYIWKGSSNGSISHFEIIRPTYTVTAATSTGTTTYGTVSAGASTLTQGSTTTITAVPADGFQVASWAVSGTGASISPSGASNSTTTTLTMGSANATVTVTFEEIPSCAATAPGSISKGAASGGTGTITLTAAGSAATNNTWYWQSAADGTATNLGSGATKDVSATGTYYLRSYCSDNGGCWSDAVSVEVSAEDLLTTPTATFSNGAYTIGSSALDLSSLWTSDSEGSVTYSIPSAGGTGASISTAAFTATTAGTATVRASQAANGNYSAITKDATITVSNPTYSVTYKANNSTAESDVVEDAESTFGDNPSFTAPSTKAFSGWNTKADGSGTHYDVGDAVPSAITVYAEWRYKVYYIYKGDSEESNDITTALASKYVVSKYTTTGTSYNASDYSDYALIVLSESLNGSDAKTSDHELKVIKGLNKPILNLKSYFYNKADNDHRWDWGTPNAGKKPKCIYVKNSTYANLTSHPIYSGLTPDGSDSIQILKTPLTTKPIQPIGEFASGCEGYTLALVPNNSSGSGTAIHEMTAAQRSTATGETITSKYLMISIQAGELSNLSDNGKTLINNAADYLITGSQWVPQYAITKSATNGSIATEVSSSAVTSAAAGSRVDITATPTTGYDFSSWSVYKTGDAETTVSVNSTTTSPTYFTMPAYAVTVAATFVESGYTISFEGNGNSSGSTSSHTSITSGSDVSQLNANGFVKTGYSFSGWKTNTALTYVAYGDTDEEGNRVAVAVNGIVPDKAKIKNVTSDITLTAQWTEDTHTVSVAAGAHGTVSPSSVSGVGIATASGNITATPSTGYSFNGWTLPSGVTAAATYSASSNPISINATADDKTITATWTTVSYTITYELNSGSLDGSEKTSYNIETEDYDLPTPTYSGHVFQGWYTDDEFTSDRVYTLAEGSTGNKTYYAKWGSDVEVNWTITKVSSKLYKGGTGYTVTAEIDDASWDASGDKDDLVLSASDGVTLSNITKSINGSDKAQVEANFSIAGDVDGDKIYFTLSVPAAGDYSAIEDEKEVELDDCPAGSGSAYVIPVQSSASDPDGAGGMSYAWISDNGYITRGFGSSSTGVYEEEYTGISSYRSNSGASGWMFKTVHGGSTIRIYLKGTQNGGTTISSVYYKTSYFSETSSATSLTPTSTAYYTSAGVSCDNIASGVAGYAELSFSSALADNSFVYFTTSKNTHTYGVSVVGSGGSGGVETSLAWSSSLADKATVTKDDVDPDFQYYASPTPSNAGGPISYTSSDESVATVSSNGTVHIVGDGSTTITASMPAYGCYSAATSITYSLVVDDKCADTPGTIVDNDGNAIAGNKVSRGACETLTLKLTGHTGSTIAWKKDGVTIVGATNATYAVPTGESGVYSATVTGACTLSSTNSITVTTAGSIDPAIFADEFTVKQGHWFGYRLMEINAGESVSVKTAPTGWVNLSDFKITTKNNIVSIEGNVSRSTGDKTLTLTITNECGGSTDKDFTIHEIAETAKPTVAWIATGDNKGADYLAAVKASESTNTALYEYLEDYYTMTPRNCYWSVSEADLVKEYSKYDLIILTDYPNSKTGPSGKGASKSYTNAIGLLIDHKPIITFEAYVAGCPNWGITTNPTDTKETQTDLTLLCNANDIFGTSDKFNAGVDISITTASSGQALQGFPIASTPDFVFIGMITDNGKHYVACCERQVETAARMMVFGLNSNIMDNMTADGKAMVKGFADYLMKTDPAEIPDCSVIFTGDGADESWYNTSNWEGGNLPNEYASVRIDKPCVVPYNNDPAKAGYIKIHTDEASGTYTGSLTIEPKGRMIVDKKIIRVDGNSYTKHLATRTSDLVLETSSDGNGVLIMGSYDGTNKATVGFYTKAKKTGGHNVNQFIGTPFNDENYVFNNYYGTKIYEFRAAHDGDKGTDNEWIRLPNDGDMRPFYGYNILTNQADERTLWMEGTLVASEDQKMKMYYNGSSNTENMFANSWPAPIDIAQFTASDFGGGVATVYIFNAGTVENYTAMASGSASATSAGQFIVLPIASAPWTSPTVRVIPSMQAFSVFASGSNQTMTLDYDRLVRTRAASMDKDSLTTATRAPRRATEEPVVMHLRVDGINGYAANMHMLEREDLTDGFDNGWDGHHMVGDEDAPQLYAITEAGKMNVNCVPNMEGTVLGFRAGTDNQFTFSFGYEGEEDWYLNDLKEQKSTLIDDMSSYTFMVEPEDAEARFVISKTPIRQTPTGCESVGGAESAKVRKLIINDKVYIIRGGQVFDVLGKTIKK